MTTWSADDALAQVRVSLPEGWKLVESSTPGQLSAIVLDADGVQQWTASGVDPKLVYLACLGWLHLRHRSLSHPAWRPRQTEVPLARPNRDTLFPDVPDLDPEEIASVYKTPR